MYNFFGGRKNVIILEHMCCHEVLKEMLLVSTSEPMTCIVLVTYLYTREIGNRLKFQYEPTSKLFVCLQLQM